MPPRCAAKTIRWPSAVAIPGNTDCPIIVERDGIMTSARPESRLRSTSATDPPHRLHERPGDCRPNVVPPRHRHQRAPGRLRQSGLAAGVSRCVLPARQPDAGPDSCSNRRRLATCRKRADVDRTRKPSGPSSRRYCSTNVRAWALRSPEDEGDHNRRPRKERNAEHSPFQEADIPHSRLLGLRRRNDIDRTAEQGQFGPVKHANASGIMSRDGPTAVRTATTQ